jgi:phosphomethylpyrimidine synthase
MKKVSKKEGIPAEEIARRISEGTVIILANRRHKGVSPTGIGKGLKTKVNTNIGTSQDKTALGEELRKLKVAVDSKTDTVMDLSTGGNLDRIRGKILEHCALPLGTVPIYQAVVETVRKKKALANMDKDSLFSVIEKQAAEGVDFLTVHCGLTREALEHVRKEGRITNVVSRGGAFLVEWMIYRDKENPLYEDFDRLLEIAAKYDTALSLGDGMRPGCIADATDRGQVQELIFLGELAQRALDAEVQVMIEGPGHIPIHQVEANVLLEKSLCHGAPFYVLGPLVTDIAPGYDHITAAIGGAIAAAAGADFLCYVTPSEHLRLPTVEDVREGVIATRIAAHAADIAKGVPGAYKPDMKLSKLREDRNWTRQLKFALDPVKARKYRRESLPGTDDVCTMCGEYCAIKKVEAFFRKGSSRKRAGK